MKRTLLFLCMVVLAMMPSMAQVDCPQVDCPGICGRFVDANHDGFCDHGHLSRQAATPTPARDTIWDEIRVSPPLHSRTERIQQESHQDTTDTVSTHSQSVEPKQDSVIVEDEQTQQEEQAKSSFTYPVWLIICGVLALYLLSVLFVKIHLWTKPTHRKVWNVLLLLTCLVSCLLGLLLALFINYGYRPDPYVQFLHWHVYVGIAMTVIAIIHALWHLDYYKNIFVNKSKKE